MTYFLEEIARYLCKLSDGDFRKYIIVFPNRRATLFFNNYLSREIQEPIWAPAYFTIFDFIQRISNMQVADPLTMIFLLFKAYKVVTGSNESFDTFFNYSEMILADFDDIDKYLVDAGMLYSNLSDIKAMEDFREYFNEAQMKAVKQFWESFIANRDSEEKQKFISIWDALFHIYTEFNALLDKEKIAYEGKAYREAVKNIKSQNVLPFNDKTVVFIGFNALNRAEEVLFDQFRNSGKALFFWDFDKKYVESDIHEAGYFIREYIKRYPPPADYSAWEYPASNTPKIKVLAVPSTISQAKVVPECLDMLQSSTTDKPGKMALVLADESILLPVVNSLPNAVKNVNISMGYPVIDTSVYAFLLALTNLQNNRNKNTSGAGCLYYHRDYFTVLNHYLLAEIHDQEIYHIFEQEAKEYNRVYIDAFALNISSDLYNAIFTPVTEPGEIGNYFIKVLDLVSKNLLILRSKDHELKWQLEILYSIQKILNRFNELLSVTTIKFSLSTAFNLLRRVLAGVSVPFSGEPLRGLQVMGILETRTLDFEKLVILSVNEGKFPKSGHIPSLIPFSLREGFNLPTIKHQDAIYAYYLYRLLHRVKEVILVYNTRSEGLQRGEPSRYIYQLLYNSGFTIEKLSAGYRINSETGKSISAKSSAEIRAKLNKYIRPGGNSFLSPSALNTFLNCKLRFYFRYVEGIDEQDDIMEDLEANIFGSILHSAMDRLYTGFQGQTVSASEFKQLQKDKARIVKDVDAAFAEVFFKKSNTEDDDFRGNLLIAKEVILKYIHGIIAMDLQNAPIRFHSLEQHHSAEVHVPGMHGAVAIGGIIDRIDEKEGITRIIDYKTGKKNEVFRSVDDLYTGKPSERNSSVFQTFLYALILTEKGEYSSLQPTLYFVRDVFNQKFNYRIYRIEDRKKIAVNDFEVYREDFRKNLIQTVDEVFNSETLFTQTEDIKYCGYCPYNRICMRG